MLCPGEWFAFGLRVLGGAAAFIGKPAQPYGDLFTPAHLGDLPAQARMSAQTLGDIRRIRHGS
jgi:hypothetical protein